MKVVCEGCQAKYRLPDDRVSGRKLKIRCRRCGGTMVIEGEHATGALLDPTTPPGGMTMPPPVEAMRRPSQPASTTVQWHVSVDGAESGPYSLTQVVQRLQSGAVPWDAYLWRDGFAEWLGVQQCSEITDRIAPPAVAPAPPVLSHDDAKTRVHQSGAFPPVSVQSGGAMAMRTSVPVPVRTSVPVPARASVPVPVPSRSITARPGAGMQSSPAVASAQPNLSQAPLMLDEPEQPPASMVRASSRPTVRPSQSRPPAVSDDAVLFSASQLGPVARPGGMSQAPQSRPGFAGGDSSGLVDIAALASLARQSSAPPTVPHATMRPASMPTTPSVQLQPLPAVLDSLAPTSRRPSGSNKTVPLAIMASAAMVASASFAAILITRGEAPPPAAAPAPAQPVAAAQPVAPQPVAAPIPALEPAAVPAAPSGGEGSEGVPVVAAPGAVAAAEAPVAEAAAVAPVAEAAAEPAVEEAEPVAAAPRARGAKRPAKARARGAAAAKAAPAEEEEPLLAEKEAPPSKTAKAAAAPTDSSDVDDLLLGDRPAKAAAEPKAAAQSADVDDLLAAPAAAKAQPKEKQSIDDLLDGAVSKGSKPTPAKPAAAAAAVAAEPGMAEAPSRDDVLKAIKGVTPAVRSCAGGQSGVAKVAIVVSGSTGAVTSATANGVEDPVKSCIEGAVRDAEFPRFSKPTFRVDYPFKF